MKKSLLYKKLGENILECQTCAHFCKIAHQKRGICGVRENKEGTLYALNYNKIIAQHIDPIEKKPLFHFLPGTLSFSIAAQGCNFRCLNCQNWDISQGPKLTGKIFGEKISPQQLIKSALENNCQSISYTYTEPTVFLEMALAIMKPARKKGLKNIWVSNGFMSEKTLNLIAPYLDAINIDLKFFDDKIYQKITGGRLAPVLKNLKEIKKRGIWLEVTTLVIPTFSDDKKTFQKIAEFIKKELGENVPWHILAFSPQISWKLKHLPPTPEKSIKLGYQIGKQKGLKYVYTGNVFNDSGENTYCPVCEKKIIERIGFIVKRYDKNGYCPQCRNKIDLILK